MRHESDHWILRYGVAVTTVTAAFLLKLLLVPYATQEEPFLLFFAAVMIAAAYGGWIKISLFIFEGAFISALGAAMRSARDRAERNALHVQSLEREILQVSENEQQRIGRDLHDGLGQHLMGIAFLSKVLAQQLKTKGFNESADASKIETLVKQAVQQARDLASGLAPFVLESAGLAAALDTLASETQKTFGIHCVFSQSGEIRLQDPAIETAMYRIAQEAIHNAVKHAQANEISTSLAQNESSLTMTIADDGIGFPEPPAQTSGIGIRSMNYRAKSVGATLQIRKKNPGGSAIVCQWNNSQPPSNGAPK